MRKAWVVCALTLTFCGAAVAAPRPYDPLVNTKVPPRVCRGTWKHCQLLVPSTRVECLVWFTGNGFVQHCAILAVAKTHKVAKPQPGLVG